MCPSASKMSHLAAMGLNADATGMTGQPDKAEKTDGVISKTQLDKSDQKGKHRMSVVMREHDCGCLVVILRLLNSRLRRDRRSLRVTGDGAEQLSGKPVELGCGVVVYDSCRSMGALPETCRPAEHEHSARVQRFEAFGQYATTLACEAEREMAVQMFHNMVEPVQAHMKCWSTEDFVPVRTLGKGGFGIVYLVKHKQSGKHAALKQMPKNLYKSKKARECAFLERTILGEVSCRWLVGLTAAFHDEGSIYLVMEFVQGGDLLYWINRKQRFGEKETSFYMAELLEALDAVHKCGYIHCDVKPTNVMLTAQGHLQLLDFGLAEVWPAACCQGQCHRSSSKTVSQKIQREGSQRVSGTPIYMSPEAFNNVRSPAMDIWALGVVTYECLYGKALFFNSDIPDIIDLGIKSFDTLLPIKLAKARMKGVMPPKADDFIRKVLCEGPNRLKAEDMRLHPFFSGIDFSCLHQMVPPIQPGDGLHGPSDASHFSTALEQNVPLFNHNPCQVIDMEWAGYEFDRESWEMRKQ